MLTTAADLERAGAAWRGTCLTESPTSKPRRGWIGLFGGGAAGLIVRYRFVAENQG